LTGPHEFKGRAIRMVAPKKRKAKNRSGKGKSLIRGR